MFVNYILLIIMAFINWNTFCTFKKLETILLLNVWKGVIVLCSERLYTLAHVAYFNFNGKKRKWVILMFLKLHCFLILPLLYVVATRLDSEDINRLASLLKQCAKTLTVFKIACMCVVTFSIFFLRSEIWGFASSVFFPMYDQCIHCSIWLISAKN